MIKIHQNACLVALCLYILFLCSSFFFFLFCCTCVELYHFMFIRGVLAGIFYKASRLCLREVSLEVDLVEFNLSTFLIIHASYISSSAQQLL